MGPAINRALSALAALAGLTAVALGAFGAHAIGDTLNAEQTDWWQTATLYLMVHAAAGLAIALSGPGKLLRIGGFIMVVGALLFAATLYAMALGAPRWLGAVTPLGGLGMMAGWAAVFIGAVRSR